MQFTFLLSAFMLLLSASSTSAFFQQFFNGQQGQDGGQQQLSWRQRFDGLNCPNYVCPDSLICAVAPAACPCPIKEDQKCFTGSGAAGSFVCARSCEDVNAAMVPL